MNYQELVLRIKSYLENDFPGFKSNQTGETFTGTQQLDAFIRQTEKRIFNLVQIPALRKNVTGNVLAGDKYVKLPTDFLAVFSLAIINEDSTQQFLLNKDVSFIRESYPNPNLSNIPMHYALFDQDSLLFGPTPDRNYGLEMHYYYYPASIVDAGTSWLGDNFEMVLLYGCLVEAYTFMKGEADLIQLYDTKYNEALGMLRLLGEGKSRRDAYRSGQKRIAV